MTGDYVAARSLHPSTSHQSPVTDSNSHGRQRRRRMESGLRGLRDRDDGLFHGHVAHRAEARGQSRPSPATSATPSPSSRATRPAPPPTRRRRRRPQARPHARVAEAASCPTPATTPTTSSPSLFADGAAELDAAGKETIRTFAPDDGRQAQPRRNPRPLPRKAAAPDGSAFNDRWDLCYARGRRCKQRARRRTASRRERIRLSQAEANEPLAREPDGRRAEAQLARRRDPAARPGRESVARGRRNGDQFQAPCSLARQSLRPLSRRIYRDTLTQPVA